MKELNVVEEKPEKWSKDYLFEDCPAQEVYNVVDAVDKLRDEIRTRYKIEKEFNEVIYCDDKGAMVDFAERHKEDPKLKNVIIELSPYEDDDEQESITSFFYDGEDYKLVCNYTAFGRIFYGFAFCKDKKKFMSDFIPDTQEVSFKPGVYTVTKGMFGYTLSKLKVSESEKPILNADSEDDIIRDVENFFDNKEFYTKNKFPYKRGILMYGTPGTGKTMLLKHLFTKFKSKVYGIIIECTKGLDLDVIKYLDNVLKDKPRILILEDIDGIESYNRSVLLNFLDGVESLENTLIIATTNFPDRLDIGLVDRPSRFDRFYEVEVPNDESRVKLLHLYFPDLKGEELDEAVKDTKGFSGAYFKELFIMKNIQKSTIKEAIDNIKKHTTFLKNKIKDDENIFG